MANTRLTIVVRRDLQLVPGLLAAQIAHMADSFSRNKIVAALEKNSNVKLKDVFEQIELDWMPEPYISVLAVNTYEELNLIQDDAEDVGLPVNVWEDTIPSHIFEGRFLQCKVGIAIGPADFDAIKLVTGMLPTY
jgi:peptidyl-tRNA hydrolase